MNSQVFLPGSKHTQAQVGEAEEDSVVVGHLLERRFGLLAPSRRLGSLVERVDGLARPSRVERLLPRAALINDAAGRPAVLPIKLTTV